MSGENYIKDGNMKKMLLNVLNGKKTEKSYSQKMETKWIMSSEEFINESVVNKSGKNKGKRRKKVVLFQVFNPFLKTPKRN